MSQESRNVIEENLLVLYSIAIALLLLEVAYFAYPQFLNIPTQSTTTITIAPTTSIPPQHPSTNPGSPTQQTVPELVNASTLESVFGSRGNYATNVTTENITGSVRPATVYSSYFFTNSTPSSIFGESEINSTNSSAASQYLSTKPSLYNFYKTQANIQGLTAQLYNGSTKGFTYEELLVTSINGTSSNMALIGYKGSEFVTVNVGSTRSVFTPTKQAALISAIASSS